MSKKITGEHSILLTYREPDLQEMMKGDYITITKKQLSNLLRALRKKAKQEGWEYDIYLGASMKDLRGVGKDLRGIGKERLHSHVYIKSNPSATVADWIKAYWYERYGLAKIKKLENDSSWGGGASSLISYIDEQSFFTKHQCLGK
jgi:hypothetical protein